MKDFTRVIPKLRNEEWPNKLGQISQLYQETEYQMVKKKFRVAAALQINQDNFQNFLDKINKDGLIFTQIRKVRTGDFYLLQPAEPGKPFSWYGCLARTYKDGQEFKEADLKNDHKVIGQMLGYPDCCIDYFKENFPKNCDPIWVNLEGKIKGYPECNMLLRYFGVKIVSHFSCSPTCEATKEIGKTWFKVMQTVDKDLANQLYNLLAGSITWNSYHEVAQVETPYFVALSNTSPILEKPRIIIWSQKKDGKRASEKKKALLKKGKESLV